MDTRLFCLIVDQRGRYRVSCREDDLDRTAPSDYLASFDEAYALATRKNRARRGVAAAEQSQKGDHSK